MKILRNPIPSFNYITFFSQHQIFQTSSHFENFLSTACRVRGTVVFNWELVLCHIPQFRTYSQNDVRSIAFVQGVPYNGHFMQTHTHTKQFESSWEKVWTCLRVGRNCEGTGFERCLKMTFLFFQVTLYYTHKVPLTISNKTQ